MTKQFIKGAASKAITGQYGEFFNLSFKLEELAKYANDKWYVNLTMSKRKEVGQYWDTHSIALNEYTPKPKEDNSWSHVSIDDIEF